MSNKKYRYYIYNETTGEEIDFASNIDDALLSQEVATEDGYGTIQQIAVIDTETGEIVSPPIYQLIDRRKLCSEEDDVRVAKWKYRATAAEKKLADIKEEIVYLRESLIKLITIVNE